MSRTRRWLARVSSDAARTNTSRVQRAIDGEQARSERLIGWAQLMLVGFFAVFYLASPKTFASDAPFEPVPVALGMYFGFTLLRLRLAYPGPLPAWFLSLSVVIDMALLFGLIWSFHIQYGQPPAFYLKAPTVLYVFIFIALRALRFEARYVLLAGAAAAAGWSLLVWYALAYPSIAKPMTRDYVEYMLQPRVLIGAEIDKIVSIVVVTLVLGLAIRRGRALMERAFTETEAAGDLARFFPPEVAERITSSSERITPGTGELRQATILFCDIRGFTRKAMEMGPNEVMGLLANYERRVVRRVHAHGGSIDKFLGDGVMATFGATVSTDTHARDGLDAVAGLIAEMDGWNAKRRLRGAAPVKVGFGVASGEVVVGAVGYGDRLEFTVIGPAVNLAAKMEKHTKLAGCRALTDDASLARAREQGWSGEAAPLGRVRIDGVAGEVALERLA